MDIVASVVGMFAVCALLLYLIFQLAEEHFLLKLLLFFIFLVCLPLIPKLLISHANYCEIVVDTTTENTTVPNITTTAYTYTRHCETNTEQTYNTLLGVTVWIWRFCIMYMLLFLTWYGLKYSGTVVPSQSSRCGWKIRK